MKKKQTFKDFVASNKKELEEDFENFLKWACDTHTDMMEFITEHFEIKTMEPILTLILIQLITEYNSQKI